MTRIHYKTGFTLAEVLITLGIIGVVAAMTLPAIINKVSENILRQQFKKAYNTVSNALVRTYANNGFWYECYYGESRGGTCVEYNDKGICLKYENIYGYDYNSQCSQLFKEMKTILKVIKICDKNAYANGCIPDMKGFDSIYSEKRPDATEDETSSAVAGAGGYKESNIKNNNAAWVLSDGTVIGYYSGLPWKLFWIDINGHKKPNKWGYDIFPFKLVGNGKRVYLEGDMNNLGVEIGGKTTQTMIKEMYK